MCVTVFSIYTNPYHLTVSVRELDIIQSIIGAITFALFGKKKGTEKEKKMAECSEEACGTCATSCNQIFCIFCSTCSSSGTARNTKLITPKSTSIGLPSPPNNNGSERIVKCTNNHLMPLSTIEIFKDKFGGGFKCSQCIRSLESSSFYRCDACNYNICITCAANEKNDKKNHDHHHRGFVMSTVDKRLDSPDRPSVEHSTVENVITRQPQADEFRPPDGIHGMTVREGGGVLMLTSDPTQPQTPPSQHTINFVKL